MSDLLDLLRDFEELSKKYNVTNQQDTWSSSPYFYSGGVSTMGSSGAWTWDKPKVVYPSYGYERYTWKDSVEDDD